MLLLTKYHAYEYRKLKHVMKFTGFLIKYIIYSHKNINMPKAYYPWLFTTSAFVTFHLIPEHSSYDKVLLLHHGITVVSKGARNLQIQRYSYSRTYPKPRMHLTFPHRQECKVCTVHSIKLHT